MKLFYYANTFASFRYFFLIWWLTFSFSSTFFVYDLTVYAPQCGLDDNQKEDLYDSLINVVWKWGKKEILVIAGDFIGHVEYNLENYEGKHVGYGYGATNKERESIYEFCSEECITQISYWYVTSRDIKR